MQCPSVLIIPPTPTLEMQCPGAYIRNNKVYATPGLASDSDSVKRYSAVSLVLCGEPHLSLVPVASPYPM